MAKHMAHKGERSSAASKELLWRRTIGQQADSGLSVRVWCRQHGVTESAFYWWRRELARRDAKQMPSDRRDAGRPLLSRRNSKQITHARRNTEAQASSFVPVHVTEDRSERGAPQIEIVLTDGRCVRVHGSVDRQMLADVLGMLTSASVAGLERRAC